MLHLSHILFLDDVILFGCGGFEEWRVLQQVLKIFCAATGMLISSEKYCFIRNGVDEDVMAQILGILPFKVWV